MIDLECMIKSLRLAWLKRIFVDNKGVWKIISHKYILQKIWEVSFFLVATKMLSIIPLVTSFIRNY